jgi:enoyl-CoA hydratase/carnithine racemase
MLCVVIYVVCKVELDAAIEEAEIELAEAQDLGFIDRVHELTVHLLALPRTIADAKAKVGLHETLTLAQKRRWGYMRP